MTQTQRRHPSHLAEWIDLWRHVPRYSLDSESGVCSPCGRARKAVAQSPRISVKRTTFTLRTWPRVLDLLVRTLGRAVVRFGDEVVLDLAASMLHGLRSCDFHHYRRSSFRCPLRPRYRAPLRKFLAAKTPTGRRGQFSNTIGWSQRKQNMWYPVIMSYR